MKVIEDLDEFPQSLSYPVMAIGIFDGVHLGHQLILKQLIRQAKKKRGVSVLLTFAPHPRKVLSPSTAPMLLQTSHQKEEILKALGVDILLRLPFTRQLSLCKPSEFALRMIHNCGVREIYVGSNFRFGHQRSGDVAILASLGEKYCFKVHEINPVCHRGTHISSSYIRSLVTDGRVALARHFLGRPHQIEGTVVRGTGQGSKLGFPTANLDLKNELCPSIGVYVSQVHFGGRSYVAVTNIGHRPTIREQITNKPVVEPHLLDFEDDIYDEYLKLDLWFYLRGEKAFNHIGDLKRQIGEDVERTRRHMQKLTELLG